MIYDCFSFFNELDLLEIRLNILNDVVDKFVLVEMHYTHSNNKKPLYFDENKERYNKFKDKIIHIIPDDIPVFENSWTYENYQRNCISKALKDCSDDDIILISDLDEIPNPDKIIPNFSKDCIKLFEMKMHYYFINYLRPEIWKQGTKILSYKNYKSILDDVDFKYSIYCQEELNQGTTATKIRMYKQAESIKEGGWHFTYLGGIDAIIYKLKSFSHQEHNKSEYLNPEYIKKTISSGKDIFGRNERYFVVKLDNTYPKYILDNQENFSHLIMPFRFKHSISRYKYFIFKSIICWIPVKKWRQKFRAKFQ